MIAQPASGTAAANRLVLGVEKSVLGKAWRDRLDRAGEARAEAIAQTLGHSAILARVLAGRGVGTGEAAAFLDPTVRALMPDPSRLADMDKAVARLVRAIEAGETIAIFGDYDVDGAASAALLAQFLQACGTPFRIHIPDRIFEGYGPNAAAIEGLAAQGARLLVTVDCGTTSFGPLAEAARLGLDMIVIDHHQAPEILPPAVAIVNPNRLDDLSGLGHLAAAGVVYMVLVALARALRERGFFSAARPPPDLLAALDLVALATIADVMPLTGLNRAFVAKGLALMRLRQRPGLTALFDAAGAGGPPRPYHLGFLLGPRINAGGRIGDAALGAKLLMTADEIEAAAIAAELNRLNGERQVLEQRLLAEAEAQALADGSLGEGEGAIVSHGDGWHPGVMGLVAARLKERFGRPAFAIGFTGDIGAGSGRSIAGIDLGSAVRAAVEAGILVKGGGHAMAAGITIERGRLAAFREFLDAALIEAIAGARAGTALFVDAVLSAGGADAALVGGLEKAGPFGAGNPEPVFAFPAHVLTDVMVVGEKHLRVRAQAGDGARLSAIAFRAAGGPLAEALLAARGHPMHLAGTLSIDRYGGSERAELQILDAAPPSRKQG